MKTLTLDKAWEYELAQYKFVSENYGYCDERTVHELKKEFLKNNGFGHEAIDQDCFFCEYDKKNKETRCKQCPARLVDHDFYCDEDPRWDKDPIGFYGRILKLNEIRLAKEITCQEKQP